MRELEKENKWRYVLTSLVVCLFARQVYTTERTQEALRAIGIERSVKELEELGNEIYKSAFEFKFREGFDFNRVNTPHRIFEVSTANGKLDEAAFKNMLREYVRTEFNISL
jgi:aldehyde:ferredoxin oxidoreductase